MRFQELGSDFAPLRVIDVGCGPGAGLSAAAHVWPSIVDLVGVDSSPGMLGAAEIMLSPPDDNDKFDGEVSLIGPI